MSRFFTQRLAKLTPYTPGEQPRDMQYIKLNTNESPFPPSPAVIEAAKAEAGRLQLYSDPTCRELTDKLASLYGVAPAQVILTNGSDEVLNFAFMAFADEDHPLVFPAITYGFYPVFAELNRIPYEEIPLKEDFSVDYRDYLNLGGKTIVIANPNAPTGLCLTLAEIEEIVRTNPDGVVVIDEAYVDFGAESAVTLTDKYDNLLVTQTFSKSRSLAGARLGFGIGNKALIADLHTVRYSTNPYNVNRMTAAAGYAALCSDLLGKALGALQIQIQQSHLGACSGQHLGKFTAQHAAGARDNGNLAAEIGVQYVCLHWYILTFRWPFHRPQTIR